MSQMRRGRKVTYTSIEERYQHVELSTQQTHRRRNHNLADKFTMVPNRIFVGGLTNGTSEQDLRNYFSAYGEVKVVKIVKDKAGALKGFGFITFGTDEEVKKIIDAGPVLMFKDKRINVAPAFEKDNKSNYDNNSPQQQSHVMSYSSQVQQYSVPPLPTPAQPMLAPVMYTYQNGMAFFNMPVSGNNPVTSQPTGPPNSTSTESLVPSVYATAPYGTQSASNMQGYSGQPIFYPNPVPQVLVQQAYPNLPMSSVCNSNPGSKVLFSVPCDTPYYPGTQMSSMIHTPEMAYPMPIMSPYMPYMVATSDGYPYYDPVMENIQLVHQPLYTEQCTNSRPPSSDASVMLNPNYPYPSQGNVRPSNSQQMFNNKGTRYGSNNYQSNKKNYSSFKGNRMNRYTSEQVDNPEVSSSEDSRTEQLPSGGGGDMNSSQVEGMCSEMRSMTI